MSEQKPPPPRLEWTAFGWGLIVAVALGLGLLAVANAVRLPGLSLIAPMIGCAAGGFVAGKQAKHDGLYHGAFVGSGWIAFEAFGLVPTVVGAGDGGVTETLTIIVVDVTLLAIASLGGLLATRRA